MDMKLLMRQAQDMQKKMQEAQEEFANQEYEGSAGGGMIKVTISGSGVAKKIDIDPSLIEKDEKDVLEDLLIAAVNDAKKKADDSSADLLKNATGGLKLPPGFKI